MALARYDRGLLFRYCPTDPRFCKRFPAYHGLRGLSSLGREVLDWAATDDNSRPFPPPSVRGRSVPLGVGNDPVHGQPRRRRCGTSLHLSESKVSALEPATGNIYWEVPYRTTWDACQVVASPVLHGDLLLCLRGWSRGSLMLKLDAEKPVTSVLWKTRSRPSTRISTPLFLDDRHFCAIQNDGSLCCLDATSGEELWSTYEPTGRSPQRGDGILFSQMAKWGPDAEVVATLRETAIVNQKRNHLRGATWGSSRSLPDGPAEAAGSAGPYNRGRSAGCR